MSLPVVCRYIKIMLSRGIGGGVKSISAAIARSNFIAFDIETTGISSFVDSVVDIGAVRFRPCSSEFDTFEQLVDPEREIPQAVTDIHGISNSDVVGQPTVEKVLPAFDKFIGATDNVLVAHNAAFDCSFLAAAYMASIRQPPPNRIICSLKLFRLAYPHFANYKLETIGKELGLIKRETHRGLADSLLLMRCLRLALARLPQFEFVDDLIAASTQYCFADFFSVDVTLPSEFDELKRAIDEEQTLELYYGKLALPRLVTPKQVFRQHNTYYLQAHCHKAGFDKTFRLDRITRFTVIRRR